MFSHLSEAFLCDCRGFIITLGYFISRTAAAWLPDLLPPAAACMCERVDTNCQETREKRREPSVWWWSEGHRLLQSETLKSCLSGPGLWKDKQPPPPLRVPFLLYYPAWLLTPGELCSQIDALLLWGCS